MAHQNCICAFAGLYVDEWKVSQLMALQTDHRAHPTRDQPGGLAAGQQSGAGQHLKSLAICVLYHYMLPWHIAKQAR